MTATDTKESTGSSDSKLLDSILNSGAMFFAGLTKSNSDEATERAKLKSQQTLQAQAQQNSANATRLVIVGGIVVAIIVAVVLFWRR